MPCCALKPWGRKRNRGRGGNTTTPCSGWDYLMETCYKVKPQFKIYFKIKSNWVNKKYFTLKNPTHCSFVGIVDTTAHDLWPSQEHFMPGTGCLCCFHSCGSLWWTVGSPLNWLLLEVKNYKNLKTSLSQSATWWVEIRIYLANRPVD